MIVKERRHRKKGISYCWDGTVVHPNSWLLDNLGSPCAGPCVRRLGQGRLGVGSQFQRNPPPFAHGLAPTPHPPRLLQLSHTARLPSAQEKEKRMTHHHHEEILSVFMGFSASNPITGAESLAYWCSSIPSVGGVRHLSGLSQ